MTTSPLLWSALILSPGLLFSQVNILTANYDLSRTNANLGETRLNHSNVTPEQFGRLYTLVVDGRVYAQPLYVAGVSFPDSGTHNVLYVATMHNSVYAFDAEAGPAQPPLWKVTLGPTVPAADWGEDFTDINPELGILSTPVIDLPSGRMFAVTANLVDGKHAYQLHALDITTGQEVGGGPVEINATVSGIGQENQDGVITFDPFWHLQRPSLLLWNGVVYVGFGSHGDAGVYRGWLLGYSAADIQQQVAVFNTSPDGESASIWMSGHAPAVDENGAVYVMTGNGAFDGVRNFGESFLKLDSHDKLTLLDWFTPDNYQFLEDGDRDLGSTGPVLISGTNLLVGGGKEGVLYLIDRNNLGKRTPGDAAVVQSFRAVHNGIFNLALWNREDGPLLYVQGYAEPVKAFRIQDGRLDTNPASRSLKVGWVPLIGLAVSANGSDPESGILWATSTEGGAMMGRPWSGRLHAFDANDLSKELWHSDQNPSDTLPSFAKFVAPTVANGRVYMPTFSNQVVVYGLTAEGRHMLGDIWVWNAFSAASDAVSPGELVVVQGDGIGPAGPVPRDPDGSGRLPVELGGVQVLFDGGPAPIVSVSAGQVVAVVPYSVAGQDDTRIQVLYQGLTSSVRTLNVGEATPGLLTADGSGDGRGAFTNEDLTANSAANPAPRRSVVTIDATGVGITEPPNDTLDQTQTAEGLPQPTLPITVTIGGFAAEVVAVVGAPDSVGAVIRLRVRVPDQVQPGDAVPFVLSAGQAGSQTVTIAVN